MAAEGEIGAAVRALRPLRGRVENFVQFEEEVKETLASILRDTVLDRMCLEGSAVHE